MFQGVWEDFFHVIEVGGYVMPPLIAVNVLLWFAIGYRAFTLKRGSLDSVRTLIDKHLENSISLGEGIVQEAVRRGVLILRGGSPHLRRALNDVFGEYDTDLKRFTRLIKVIVVIAPLLGLLGTVSGMIETFDSLEDMSLFSQSGGIAGGISRALFTTQLGLAVAIPGLMIKGYLDKKQMTIEMELSQIKDILCGLQPKQRAVEASE